jgi:hypothetical protein
MSNDYFDQVNGWAEKFHGTKMSDDEIIKEFVVRGFESRVAMLHQLEQAEDKGELTSEADIRKAANRMNLKRRLNQTHHTLRLAGK